MIGLRAVSLLTAAAMMIVAVAVSAREAAPLSATRLMSQLGLTLGEQAAIDRGEVVSRALEQRRDNELAALAIVRTPAPVEAVTAVIMATPGSAGGPAGLSRIVQVPVIVSDWRDIDLPEAEVRHISRQVAGNPSERLNLAASEATRLRGLAGPDLAEAYRQLLIARMESYANTGLAGIEPYARTDGESSPALELAAALEASRALLDSASPAVVAALTGAPLEAGGVSHRFSWSRPDIDGRVGIVLSHEVIDQSPQSIVLVQRQFFVSHAYNSLQSITVVLPVGDGSLIARIGRSYTDRVAGPFSGMEKQVGQKMMRTSLVDTVEKIAARAMRQSRRATGDGTAPG